ncbi:nucleotidyl transferase AbiEii/AbiGii toxin family protein [Dysgonomonas sp. Marseille-P4361]|uniref:nucleotidyl transferase AbiEii/AbiGii toxin family protein n=1 Tax=Dysgonomonas sp. Marseille-P4361 TaxID=2161820 RepID=UPI000D54C8A3|nr:nucleotidyl transferase AbiEii/AbiGii toxin family protein [Dysgonomonas sp. Marseille-P4361]
MASLNDIKKITLRALMSDDLLMHGLVLKGGNALQLAYDLTNRGSVDIDFSMENEFSANDFNRLTNVFCSLLNEEFKKSGLTAYDVKFIEKPKTGDIPEWKGYLLEFKLIETEQFNIFGDDINAIRRNSIKVNNQSTKYTVDISAYEFIAGARPQEIEGLILKVYTPEMILIEKVRALCQSMPEYAKIVSSARQKQRARDFYDIWLIVNSFPKLQLTIDLFRHIFEAKKVPLEFLKNMESLREPNRAGWDTVQQTISAGATLESYDYYFDHLLEIISPFINLLDSKAATSPNT